MLFGQHHIGELSGGHPVRMGERDLGVLANGGDRRAQLVRRVGYEAALTVSCAFQPLQHAIHGGGQSADLVVGLGLRHPAVQLRGRDFVHLAPDRLDRRQRAADENQVVSATTATITGSPMISSPVTPVVVSKTSTTPWPPNHPLTVGGLSALRDRDERFVVQRRDDRADSPGRMEPRGLPATFGWM